jgi:Type II secretion system (T2SS), protein G
MSMGNLTNSKRISYKATYNQISPSATVKAAVQPTGRAFEKAAFVQSLAIVPSELAVLNKSSPEREAGTTITKAQLSAALKAISTLVADQSTLSTFNNAALFSAVSPAVLTYIAGQLATSRQQLSNVINRSLSDIVSAYRNSMTPQKASAQKASAQKSAASAPAPKLPKNAKQTSSTTQSGIPIVTTIVPGAATAKVKGAEVGTQSYRIHVALDGSQPAPASLSSVLSPGTTKPYSPPTAEALRWAEKSQPDLFNNLLAQVQPHMGLSTDQLKVLGAAISLVGFLKGPFATKTNPVTSRGAQAAFEDRMQVEPVGNLHLERIEMYPAGVERGELLYSLPLTPGETVNVSHKEWAVTEKEFADIVQDSFAGYSEQGVAEKTDVAMSNDSQSQHATALNVGASLSASYSSVTLSTSFGYNSSSNDSQSKKDSRNHSMSITKQASARTKKDHKTTFTVTSVNGSVDQSVRVISNPSQTDAMRVDYFQLARKWKVDLLRYGLRMTYDLVIPNPGSAIVTLVDQVASLNAMIETPFTFSLPLSDIWYNPFASDPQNYSNYDLLAAQYGANVTAPPAAQKWVNVDKETEEVTDYDHVHFDSVQFAIDENYYIYDCLVEYNYQFKSNEQHAMFEMLDGSPIEDGLNALIGMSGTLSLDFMYQNVYNYGMNITFICRPQAQSLTDWRLQAWNQLRQAAQDQYNATLQTYKDQLASLQQQIASFDALTLRRMEQEEIMKGVLRWLLGPTFYLVPVDIASLFGPDLTDPDQTNVLDPNKLSFDEWSNVLNHGEFIKFIHNAIEWENVLYFTYPYFWDDSTLWDFKKFLYHPDSTHRTFLRAGAARVVLTIRPGFETVFTTLVDKGDFSQLPAQSPYVTIAQEIQDFANTNYPGFPPANPEDDARPLVYLEQRRVWTEMQFTIQLLNAYKAKVGVFPPGAANNAVPVPALTPYLDGPITINGINYNGINDYNNQSNAQQLVLDPTTPADALLPTYAAVPANDVAWNNPYFYKCPGDTGDYDLICYGSDGQPGGTDKAADISANCEASLISTWFEYTPTAAMDIGITMNQPNVVPPQPDPQIS